jgi:hypothetical protein
VSESRPRPKDCRFFRRPDQWWVKSGKKKNTWLLVNSCPCKEHSGVFRVQYEKVTSLVGYILLLCAKCGKEVERIIVQG